MKLTWILVSLAVLSSGSPQKDRKAILFPMEENSITREDDDGLEEFDNDPDERSWFPGNEDDTYSIENEFVNRNAGDFDESDDSLADVEPYNFVREEDLVELPDWMDFDLNELPLDKVAVLNNMTALTDLAGFFELDKENAAKLSRQQANGTQPEAELAPSGRAGEGSSDAEFVKKNYEIVKFARCSPEEVTVKLPVPKKTIYLPSCVRLKRCGGCCNNDLLSCQPTKHEEVLFNVLKISKNKRRSRRRGRRASGQLTEMIEVNHMECSCQCKTREEHCDRLVQNYNKDACACVCKDQVKQMKCEKSSRLHYWNKRSCTCMCRKVKECSTGELFSQTTCGCLPAVRFRA